MNLLALDPGIRGCGVAFFQDGELQTGMYVPNPAARGNGPEEVRQMVAAVKYYLLPRCTLGLDELVIEWPQVYSTSRGKDPNDLLPLVGIGCGLACVFPRAYAVRYLPREWKSTMAKGAAFEKRVLDRLGTDERQFISGPRSLLHNVYDAIGLGLFHLGRFKPARVFAR